MRAKLGIGVIGVGAIGRLHAQHVATRVPGARLVAVADVDRGAAEACAAQCGGPTVYDRPNDLLADREVEAVVISSPPDTHAEIIQDAAAAGKHIFCEKPVDIDLQKTEQALAAVARAGVKLQIGFNRRFDANFRHIRDVIAAGRIGRPLILHIVSRDPKPPAVSSTRAIAGLFLDMTIHDFDMARYLLGSEVSTVYAIGGRMLEDAGDPDTAIVTLRFANGAIGAIDNGHTLYGYDQRVEVFGTEGSIAAENETPHRTRLLDRHGSHSAPPSYFFAERYADAYVEELAAFVACIVNDTKPEVTGADGRAAALIALAAQRSYDEGRPVAMRELGA